MTLTVVASAFSAFAGCNRGDAISDSVRAQMSERTENAQFMPEAQSVMGGAPAVARTAVQETETAFDVFDMERLLADFAVIQGNGAGKYLGYEVDEIKMEMYNMVNRAPFMNEWFRVPRADDGSEYFSNWAYLIENDLEYNFLSITRISWRTRASYFDPETQTQVEDYEGGSAIQYNVMRTQYYMDENTEIVEVDMLDVMQAHDETHFMAYQSLKNAKDKYFIKYKIEAKPRTLLGYAIDTQTPYGANREFTYMEYENSDFDLLQISQRYPNAYRSDRFRQEKEGAEMSLTSRKDGVYNNYALTYTYAQEGTEETGENKAGFESALNKLFERLGGEPMEEDEEQGLTALSKKLVDEHALALEWEEIFKESEGAPKEIRAEIPLPIKAKYWYPKMNDCFLEGALGDVEYFGRNKRLCTLETEAYLVPNPAFRNMLECNYYLAPALMKEDGTLYFLQDDGKGAGNDFDPEHNVMWYGCWLEYNRTLTMSDFEDLTERGEYALVFALKEKGKDGNLGNIRLVDFNASWDLDFSFTIGDTGYRCYTKDKQVRVAIVDADEAGEKGEIL